MAVQPKSIATTTHDQLAALYNSRSYNNVVFKALELDINPSNDPQCSNIVAASLFQLSKFDDCLTWCDGLAPSFERIQVSLQCMAQLFEDLIVLLKHYQSLKRLLENPEDPPLLNYANLLIDLKNYEKAKSILDSLITTFPIMRMLRLI